MSRFALIFIFVGLTLGCKKSFLNVPNKVNIYRQEYVKDLTTLNEYLSGIYIMLSSDFYYGYNIIYGDLIADNVKPTTGSNVFLSQYLWSQKADETKQTKPEDNPINMNPIWTIGYRISRSCNFVVSESEKYRVENPVLADEIKGQALVIRALVYHHLVNVFAQSYSFSPQALHPGIPYVTDTDLSTAVTRNSVKSVYESLIDDLNIAIPLLPEDNINKSYISRKTAKALLSRVYLYKGDFQSCKDLTLPLMVQVPLLTDGYPDNLFSDKDNEAIFRLYPSLADYITYFPNYFYKTNVFNATQDIKELLDQRPNDVRRKWITGQTELKVNKFPSGVVPGVSYADLAYYVTIFRSSELYLNVAESYANLQKADSAAFYLDKVKQRADSTAPKTTLTGKDLLEDIYIERRKEFCFEGVRMYDLLRLRKPVTRQDAATATSKVLNFPDDKAIAPIPSLDVIFSKLQQNPSY